MNPATINNRSRRQAQRLHEGCREIQKTLDGERRTLATFPGEWVDQSLPTLRLIPTSWWSSGPTQKDWTSSHEMLFDRGWFSNRLVLTDRSFVNPDKLDKSGGEPFVRGTGSKSCGAQQCPLWSRLVRGTSEKLLLSLASLAFVTRFNSGLGRSQSVEGANKLKIPLSVVAQR